MDLTRSIEPDSTQLNADDLVAGPRTVTIKEVRAGSDEQPVDVFLQEFPRPWRPSKSMRRVLVAAWGADSTGYAGKRLTLYRDPSIKFGKDEVGGIRVSHMSGIGKRMDIALTITKGKRQPFTVQPLPDDAPTSPPQSEEQVSRLAELRKEWQDADPERRAAIEAEVKELDQ